MDPEGNPGMQPLFAPSGSVILGMQALCNSGDCSLRVVPRELFTQLSSLVEETRAFLRLALGV